MILSKSGDGVRANSGGRVHGSRAASQAHPFGSLTLDTATAAVSPYRGTETIQRQARNST